MRYDSSLGFVRKLYDTRPPDHQLVVYANSQFWSVRNVDESSVYVSRVVALEVSEEVVQVPSLSFGNYWFLKEGKTISLV